MLNIRPKGLQQTPTASNRQPEKWFRRLLWIVALIFAGFLIGLGGKIVADLPFVKPDETTIADYVADRPAYDKLKKDLETQQKDEDQLNQQLYTAELNLEQQKSDTANAQYTFNNWLATRSVTEQSEQNPEVIKRTKELEVLKAKEQVLQKQVHVLESQRLAVQQNNANLGKQINQLEEDAFDAQQKAQRHTELVVFLYRLIITLPLLLLAWYLFSKHRQGTLWPFVWGFVFFALFAFFVELVPYLPSYGGYVRYGVGIVLTFVIGRYAIIAMNRYLARKKDEEELSISERQSQLNYDQAQAKLAKEICPSCERKLNLNDPNVDYCPHCGICLFQYCHACTTRNSAFNHYCCKCGADSQEQTV